MWPFSNIKVKRINESLRQNKKLTKESLKLFPRIIAESFKILTCYASGLESETSPSSQFSDTDSAIVLRSLEMISWFLAAEMVIVLRSLEMISWSLAADWAIFLPLSLAGSPSAPSWKISLAGFPSAPSWRISLAGSPSAPSWRISLVGSPSAPSWRISLAGF